MLADARWVAAQVPPIAADAHKGSRRKLAIVGGGDGMAGASMLAARAAARSGIGMTRLIVAPDNLAVVQSAAYESLARAWPLGDDEMGDAITSWADTVLIGPGLGRSRVTRELVERTLRAWRGPVVVDADALNVFENDSATLGSLLRGRPAIVTPHPAELARLTGFSVQQVLDGRFEIGVEVARALGAAVLLKGVPTVISDIDGNVVVSASGTPALAAAGSGDVLAGVAATLLAQTRDAAGSAAAAAWIHGRAAEAAGADRALRGVTLDDIISTLSSAWMFAPSPRVPVLAELPPVGESA
jgi:NAD(P)H-hydrate epimerase